MDTALIIIGVLVVAALALLLIQKIGRRRKIARLENISGERRESAQAHEARATELESRIDRERAQAEQHRETAREAEQKLAEKAGR